MFKSFFNKTKGHKNKRKLLDICDSLIDSYEENARKVTPSCKQDLMEAIEREIEASSDEIQNWQDYNTDYIEIAHKLLAHLTFDLLASGRYHLYAGILNPHNCSSSLRRVHDMSLAWGVSKRVITQEEMDDQIALLQSEIKHMG